MTGNTRMADRQQMSTLPVRLCTSVGVVLLAFALGLKPPGLSVEWWLLVVAALLLGHAAAEIQGRPASN